ncbi:MAG: hypothetical protein V1934_07065 [Methanobacteriota archaeon]
MTEHQRKPEPRCDCHTCRLARIEASIDSLRKSVDDISASVERPFKRDGSSGGRD